MGSVHRQSKKKSDCLKPHFLLHGLKHYYIHFGNIGFDLKIQAVLYPQFHLEVIPIGERVSAGLQGALLVFVAVEDKVITHHHYPMFLYHREERTLLVPRDFAANR